MLSKKEIELKLFDYDILVDNEPKQIIQTVNGLINDLELYNEREEANYSAKYACTRQAINKLLEEVMK
jgi:hypothetical protein